jgi:hypothetical protein
VIARAAERRGLPREIHVVLDRDRHAEQGQPFPRRQPPVGLGRLCPGRLLPYDPERADRLLRGVDALQRELDEVAGRKLPGREPFRLGNGIRVRHIAQGRLPSYRLATRTSF